MAVRLYKDAVRSGFLDWRIPDIPLDSEGTSQPASSPALPHAQAVPSRPPSQAFRPSQGSHSQHLQSSSSLPRSNGQSHHRGRAFEPAGPSNSPSAAGWNPPSSSGARPNPSSVSEVNRLQCDLLVHPSSSFRGVPDEEQDLSLSQRLSQGQSCTQTLSQSASRPLHGRPSPTAEQPAVKSRREEDILQIVQITDCSYAKAQRVSALAACRQALTLCTWVLPIIRALGHMASCFFVTWHVLCFVTSQVTRHLQASRAQHVSL